MAEVQWVKKNLLYLTPENCVANTEATVKAAKIVHKAVHRERKSAKFWQQLLESIERSNVLLVFWSWLHLQRSEREANLDSAYHVIYLLIFEILWNLTDVSTRICEQAINAGMVEAYLKDLQHPKYLESRLTEKSDHWHYATGCLGTLVNLAEKLRDKTAERVRNMEGEAIIEKYLSSKRLETRIRAIILLSNFLNDTNKSTFVQQLPQSDAQHFIDILDDAFAARDHLSNNYDRHVLETMNAVARISRLSDKFVLWLSEVQFLTKAVKYLTAPTELPESQSDYCLYCTKEEKLSLLSVLVAFTVHNGGRQKLLENEQLVNVVLLLPENCRDPQIQQKAAELRAICMNQFAAES